MDDVKDLFVRLVGGNPGAQEPPHRQMHALLSRRGNHGVGRLLHPVVQKGIASWHGRRPDQSFQDGLGEIIPGLRRGLLAHQREGCWSNGFPIQAASIRARWVRADSR